METAHTRTGRREYFFSILTQAPIYIIISCVESCALMSVGTLAIIAASLLFGNLALLILGLPIFYIWISIQGATAWSGRKFSIWEIIIAYIELGTSYVFYFGLAKVFFGTVYEALFYVSISVLAAKILSFYYEGDE